MRRRGNEHTAKQASKRTERNTESKEYMEKIWKRKWKQLEHNWKMETAAYHIDGKGKEWSTAYALQEVSRLKEK